MGSKVPPNRPLDGAKTQETEDGELSGPLGSTPTRLMLQRIADTLGVPVGALRDRPALPEPVKQSGSKAPETTDIESECRQLVEAYRRIQDPHRRQRYLNLILLAGEEG